MNKFFTSSIHIISRSENKRS